MHRKFLVISERKYFLKSDNNPSAVALVLLGNQKKEVLIATRLQHALGH